jgi:anoctamin-10/anoctamin-7
MYMLAENLLIVLLVSLTSDKFEEFILPLLSFDRIKDALTCKWSKLVNNVENVGKNTKATALKEYSLPTYDFNARLADYTTLFVLFGYVVMFSPSLPIAALFVSVSVFIEVRGDLNKLHVAYRRVQPRGAQDIGTWQTAFEIITTVGVISNSALIVFTMGMFSYYSTTIQIWIFICMQWFLFTLIRAASDLVPDYPARVTLQKARSKYYSSYLTKLNPLLGRPVQDLELASQVDSLSV